MNRTPRLRAPGVIPKKHCAPEEILVSIRPSDHSPVSAEFVEKLIASMREPRNFDIEVRDDGVHLRVREMRATVHFDGGTSNKGRADNIQAEAP
jgi:RecB family exonuclease